MEFSRMNEFLSDCSIQRHVDYSKRLRLKFSVLEKSDPSLLGLSLYDIKRKNFKYGIKSEAVELASEILSHEIFFSSFDIKGQSSETCDFSYGTVTNFLYKLFVYSQRRGYGFVYVYADGRITDTLEVSRKNEKPTLAIDMCEHAYFSDYGFDRERYLEALLPRLSVFRLKLN